MYNLHNTDIQIYRLLCTRCAFSLSVEFWQFPAVRTIPLSTGDRIDHQTVCMKPFDRTVFVFTSNHSSFFWSSTVAEFVFKKLMITAIRICGWRFLSIPLDSLNASTCTWSSVPFSKQLWKNTSCEKCLCFDHTIIPEEYVFGDTLNVNTSLLPAKCAHTEIAVLHISHEQLCLDLIIVGMITIKMKWSIRAGLKAKLAVFGSSSSYVLSSMTIGTFYLQRTLTTTCAQQNTIRRCPNEGP